MATKKAVKKAARAVQRRKNAKHHDDPVGAAEPQEETGAEEQAAAPAEAKPGKVPTDPNKRIDNLIKALHTFGIHIDEHAHAKKA